MKIKHFSGIVSIHENFKMFVINQETEESMNSSQNCSL